MASPEHLYRGSVRAFSAVMVLLGLAILATTFANGGGPLSIGTLMGIAFLAVGLLRGWLGGGGPPWRRAPQASEHMGEGRRDGTRGQPPPEGGRDRTRGQPRS
jgi:hypothetical protein